MMERSLACLLNELGFENIEKSAFHQLLDVAYKLLRQLIMNIKTMMELQSRTEPCPSDVSMAITLMNVTVNSLRQTLQNPIKHRPKSPEKVSEPPQTKLFRVNHSEMSTLSTTKYRPSHVPDYLPDYPDPHTFMASETFADLRKDYTRARQTLAEQRRALQRSLVKFKTQTSETIPLIKNENESFLLIRSKPCPLPYLYALMPHDLLETSDLIVNNEQLTQQQQRKLSISEAPPRTHRLESN
ncbi:unnamed protein product [Didymodactylos carnosus]|uniref:Transcription initiation factor TFIID subunit 8 n=1 Tax=Didymodactylos carnosus TaxID=1234261 RepID=A0A813W807_9BILA|nr:unnamed protein product [Didymodactylos carnosus]CAF0972060.1 unnamed protein product [Didymodactylos carnosus]CAF3638883.1 unnamed protein product [Didymodactylos carnosus]CAF3743482.1 unnamed protein product [Didymodactylos carnosus]